ncbi:hypothetical protein FNAPI_12622 [Fusarium napiforme]|uniref:Uncharacterized protein n=1 Tax=Fusarium napiforme TaxID=42672 RepID=A0A8H5MMX3_9HYPO|nr:hypothetical protein FNAPI_12622 [Fusarium napiforme]
MASASFDHTAVDPLKQEARRAHMNAFFMHLGLWDSAKVTTAREKCVEMYCKLLYERGHVSVSQEYFEYQVDCLVWFNILKRGKALTEATKWPWAGTIPEISDSTTQASVTYRDWLHRKHDAKNDGDCGRTNAPEAVEVQEHRIPADTVVDESFKEAKPRVWRRLPGDPYINPKVPVPCREGWDIPNWEKVDACQLPDADLREMIWRRVVSKPHPDPLTGPFELALPDWLDFHNLVLHNFKNIAKNRPIDPDVTICWRVKDSYPISLVVSLITSREHDGESITFGFIGSPVRLVDYLHFCFWWVVRKGDWGVFDTVTRLIEAWEGITSDSDKAVADAKLNRENMDNWVPETHAILTQPRPEVPLLIENWVRREGSDSNTLFALTTLARNTWALFSIDDGRSWFDAFSAKNRND